MRSAAGPCVSIRLDIIRRNARAVTARCAGAGISVFGVTKGTCGMPEVARAMLAGGVDGIAEARLDNIRRLRDGGVAGPIMLLRTPALSQAGEAVRLADISLNSDLSVVAALSRCAVEQGRTHRIVLMLDLGDLREGIWPADLPAFGDAAAGLPGIEIVGIGTNLNCLGGILPSAQNMAALLDCAAALRARCGLALPVVSGGNSGSLPLLLGGGMPAGISHLRIGEAILQGGRDTFFDTPWTALERGAFTLSAELLEVKVKPSLPIGERGVDAFGRVPDFADRGDRLRGILDIGLQDVGSDSLFPCTAGVSVLGASSDHLVVDLGDMARAPQVGDRLSFQMGYGSLLRSMTSSYVEKRLLDPESGDMP